LFPRIVSRLPRAGKWTDLFKQSVGFVFLLIAAWMLGVLTTDARVIWVLAYAVVLAMCLWMWGSWLRYDAPAGRKWAVRGAAVAVAAACGWWMLTPPSPPAVKMLAFDADRIARTRADGGTVLVKFTATWCVECKVVDMTIYDDAEVARELARRGVAVFKGDVTGRDMPAGAMLYEQLGQVGPPVTAILPPGDRPALLLRGAFSRRDLFAALDAARGGSASIGP